MELGRWGAQAWALGWALGAGLGVQARRQQAWQQALGCAGTARACADGRWCAWQASGRQGAAGRRGAREAHGVGARGARPGRTWARGLGVPGRAWCTGWASLGLMQPVWVLTWVFDSVVFLSHRLDSVHEHCSVQNFFRKKKF